MLTEMRDTVPLVMKADGVDLAKATDQDWLDAIDKIQEAVDSGQIRDFTGNDYADDLTRGDVVAAIGWSGDAVQLQADNPNIEWRMPDEGCMLWTDNMLIPVGAPNTDRGAGVHELRLRPEVRQARHRRSTSTTSPRSTGSRRSSPSAIRRSPTTS